MLKKSFLRMLTFIIGSILIFVFTACDNGSKGGGPYTVKYEITGPAITADFVRYYNESGVWTV